MFGWLETTTLAVTVRDSLFLTALLSGLHVVGMTVVSGGALVRGLREADAGVTAVLRLALGVSLFSGTLLLLPRAASATANDYFLAKMALLAAAAIVEGLIAFRRGGVRQRLLLCSALLWAGVACLGAAYILLE